MLFPNTKTLAPAVCDTAGVFLFREGDQRFDGTKKGPEQSKATNVALGALVSMGDWK